MILLNSAALRTSADDDSVVLDHLAAGEMFDALELGPICAWGVASEHGLVGYVATTALAPLHSRPEPQ